MVVEFVGGKAIEKSKQTTVGGLSNAIFMFNICTKIIIALRHMNIQVHAYMCSHTIIPKFIWPVEGVMELNPRTALGFLGLTWNLADLIDLGAIDGKACRMPFNNCQNSSR